ncbi:staphylopine uptake ABC transporter ATP-binding protein CntD [Paenibacillus sp. OAS669]|uniref:staphylopine uptake ABC transporter ATP-binding protein CntD n=1 Tax=Paenibacillus sp. OAS669 TaxID=2663821 RepID=UPI00178AAF16|nr:ABC transporter ATP-binding protein [Paenibacillus sp. OAS669]MBE1442803.1 nickel transport system ATP-binding protein [Paenibacillus sp. OAS669]
MNVLEVDQLKIWDSLTGSVLVPGSSFCLRQGECLAIVGESGSGKSLTCRAVMRLNATRLHQSGSIILKGVNLSELSEKDMRKVRGKQLCMIMQNGMRAFDPSRPVGAHLRETLSVHYDWKKEEAAEKLMQALESVGLNDPAAVMSRYPHELSGGMLQRIMIALAIVLEPDIIIADEPTTALDAVTQYEVVEQFLQLRRRIGSSMIFVTHDLGVVQRIADEILVMKDGEIVERGATGDILTQARHPYTRYLVSTKMALNHNFMKLMGGNHVAKG